MGERRRHGARRTAGRAIAAVLLAALCAGLTTAPAFATETNDPAPDTTATAEPEGGRVPNLPPTLVAALASARDVALSAGEIGRDRVAMVQTTLFDRVYRGMTDLQEILDSDVYIEPIDPEDYVELAELHARVQAAVDEVAATPLPVVDPYEMTEPVRRLVLMIELLAADVISTVQVILARDVQPVVDSLPTVDEVVTLATGIKTYLQEEGGRAVEDGVAAAMSLRAYISAQVDYAVQHAQDEGDALRAQTAQEAAEAQATAEELAAYLDQLVAQAVNDGLVESAKVRAFLEHEVAQAIANGLADAAVLRAYLESQVATAVDDGAAALVTVETRLAQLRAQAVAGAEAVQRDLLGMLAYLTDEQHQRGVKAAVTTLLVTLGSVVNPIPEAYAPTIEAAFTASGELVSLADSAVQDGLESPSVFYGKESETDEPAPSEDVRVIDSDLILADEPVVVPGRSYGTRGPIPVVDGAVEATPLPVDCGMYSGYPEFETCRPPVTSRGGRVIHRPVVRVVLVGSWFAGEEGQAMKAGFDSAFGSMSGSSYQAIIHQYYDKSGHVGLTVDYQGAQILNVPVRNGPHTESEVGAFAVKAAGRVPGWKTADNVVWVVAMPPGSPGYNPKYCGYQGDVMSGDRKYVIAEVDYPRKATADRVGCQFVGDNVRANATIIAVHEYVGAVVNPDGDGWADDLGQHLPDLCRARFVNGPGGEMVSKVWSNGDNRCVSSFTPRYAYSVVATRVPDGDQGPGTPFTRGHTYPGAYVNVRNTGNMPWLFGGGKTTYLATADNACSRFAARGTASGWASCRRITLTEPAVAAGKQTSIPFGLRPDGSVDEESPRLSQTFRMVAGSTWMTNTGSQTASLTGLRTHRFAARVLTGLPDVGHVAAGLPGTEVEVSVTLHNTGSATWYPREVVNIGTLPGTTSPYAAASWPKGPNGCRGCRAHRVDRLVRPGEPYTFKLTLHIPKTKVSGVETFYPYHDVQRLSDGVVVAQRMAAPIKVRVVTIPVAIGAHQVTGQGFADGGAVLPPEPGTNVSVATSGFSCAAVSGADAVSTSVTSCTATITKASGEVYTVAVGGTTAHGSVAVVTGQAEFHESAGDTISICWGVSSTFLDGTTATSAGCNA